MSILGTIGTAAKIGGGILVEATGRTLWASGEILQKAADLCHSGGASALAKADEIYDSAGLERRPWEEAKIRLYRKLADDFGPMPEGTAEQPAG